MQHHMQCHMQCHMQWCNAIYDVLFMALSLGRIVTLCSLYMQCHTCISLANNNNYYYYYYCIALLSLYFSALLNNYYTIISIYISALWACISFISGKQLLLHCYHHHHYHYHYHHLSHNYPSKQLLLHCYQTITITLLSNNYYYIAIKQLLFFYISLSSHLSSLSYLSYLENNNYYSIIISICISLALHYIAIISQLSALWACISF